MLSDAVNANKQNGAKLSSDAPVQARHNPSIGRAKRLLDIGFLFLTDALLCA
jgi:hypothetical protein